MADSILTETEAHQNEAVSANAGARAAGAFKTVLVGVDGTSAGRDAIALGETLRAHDGRLILAHVVPTHVPSSRTLHSTRLGRSARELLARERSAAGVSADLAGTLARSVRHGLDELADESDADLVVVGSRRGGAIRRLLGRSYALRSPRPVAIAPSGYAERLGPLKAIGVAYDATPESQDALAAAVQLADQQDAAVQAMVVVSEGSVDAATRRRTIGHSALSGAAIRGSTNVAPALTAAAWSASSGRGRRTALDRLKRAAEQRLRALRGVEGRVVVGSPVSELLAFGDQVDLLIVGSRSHRLLRQLILGSTSARLAESAEFPVLVVPRPTGPRGAREH